MDGSTRRTIATTGILTMKPAPMTPRDQAAVTRLAASAILLLVATAAVAPTGLSAADPYDATLEKRIEALEREMNTLAEDAKGKNPAQTYEVPAFLRAAGKQVQELTIQGDLRFRYQYDNDELQVPSATARAVQQSRSRFRLRLNLNYQFSDHWFAGLGVQTAASADSGHQTVTGGFDNSSVYLSLYFLGWKVNDHVTLLGGKILSPFYNNTDAFLDFSDVRPVGLTERFNFDLTPQLNLKVNLGQYAFYDNPENGSTTYGGAAITDTTRSASGDRVAPNGRDGDLKTDVWFLYQDVVLTWKPTNAVSVIVAPGFYTYVGGGAVGVTGPGTPAAGATLARTNNNQSASDASYSGTLLNTAPFNDQNAARNLYVGFLGGEVNFPVAGRQLKLYGDYLYNFAGGKRDYDAYGFAEDKLMDKQSWLAGAQWGELKKKGDFYLQADFRQFGLGSSDPNLNDPHFALSRINVQGFRVAAGYNFYAWLKGEVIYFGAWNLEKNLHTRDGRRATADLLGSTGRLTFADQNSSQVLQVQLTASF